MVNLSFEALFAGVYRNKKVVLLGHTGFKGSWLYLWLTKMGANVVGISISKPSNPCHFDYLNNVSDGYRIDINHLDQLKKVMVQEQPEIIFHLAAQPLVRLSYQTPIETLQTNIIGTANVLEACRNITSLKAIVVITTDKCYENQEINYAYKEDDKLGGFDPYSASKACAEIITSSYRNSFYASTGVNIATARAGNVIGGGDWALDRLIPDLVKNHALNKFTEIRSPGAVRPWQHVLEPLSGYLLLGQKLFESNNVFDGAWNFGPEKDDFSTVENVVNLFKTNWKEVQIEYKPNNGMHEAVLLTLDSTKAKTLLHWEPIWDIKTAITKTADWYKGFYQADKLILTETQLTEYVKTAIAKNLNWTT